MPLTETAPRTPAVPPEDTDLHRALVGDLDAGFADLVRTYQRLLHTVALRTTGNAADAEDLAAEAFLRAYRALRGYDADRIRGLDLRPWLLTVLLNVRRNDARTAARRPAADPTEEPPERPARERSVEEHAEQAELSRALGDLLAGLPAPQRTAVVLRHVVDLPIAEIAAVLGCAEGTVKSHISRGLARLRAAAPCAPDGRLS